ncbi:aerobic sulfatase maturase family protein [Bordetella pertussis]|nr:aerobic sulfatase maturase family protein [Bordetella pertussis]CPO38802.1 aerobic sulfatase maturase family protein [Bordetella pertussis]
MDARWLAACPPSFCRFPRAVKPARKVTDCPKVDDNRKQNWVSCQGRISPWARIGGHSAGSGKPWRYRVGAGASMGRSVLRRVTEKGSEAAAEDRIGHGGHRGRRGRAGAYVASTSDAPQAPAVRLGDGKAGPADMAWIPGHQFLMGNDHKLSQPNERPAHQVRVSGFWMDVHDVTNAQFRRFVQATGYLTTAERKPRWEDLRPQLPPGTPRPDDSQLVPGAMVFVGTQSEVSLRDYSRWWRFVPGASWRHPQGPGSGIDGKDDHPVVQVSYGDAQAYARWAGKRRPPRPNGNSPRAAGWSRPPTPGATSCCRRARPWPTSGIPASSSRFRSSRTRKCRLARRRWAASRPMAMAFTTWPAMCGNGRPTGTGPTRSGSRPSTANPRSIRPAPPTVSTRTTAMCRPPRPSA